MTQAPLASEFGTVPFPGTIDEAVAKSGFDVVVPVVGIEQESVVGMFGQAIAGIGGVQ